VTGRPAKSTPEGACAGAVACAKPATFVGGPVTAGADELDEAVGDVGLLAPSDAV
jgi:hypothetical protein